MTQWGLDTLFNPAKRHMDEEKRRLQSTREEIGDASGGKRIDLESGKVTVQRSERDEDETDADADTSTDGTVDNAAEAEIPSDEASEPVEETVTETAADRARRRHQRARETSR